MKELRIFKKISVLFLAIAFAFTANICVLAEEAESDVYTVTLSPENYAGIFFNVSEYYHKNDRAIEAYYNTRYSTNDYLLAEHFSMIASYNVPVKNALTNITMSWWINPSGTTATRTVPVFYDLNKFAPDIETGVYKGVSGSEEEGYKVIEEWAKENYWPATGYSDSTLPFSSKLAHSIYEASAGTYTYDVTDKLLASYVSEECTSEYITFATGRETSGYVNALFRMKNDGNMPYITVTYSISDILAYVNDATTESITKVISDIGVINVLSESTASFSEYKELSDSFKQIVGEAVLSARGENGFSDFSEISSAFSEAMNLESIILSIINNATEETIADDMLSIGDAGAFSESETGYQAYLDMSAAAKNEVNKNMLSLIPEESGFASVADLASAFDNAMELKTVSFEISPVNYATLYLTQSGYYTTTNPLNLHYNRVYSNDNYINTQHMSIISGFEIPAREELVSICANYTFTPGNNTSADRIQPFFYDLNKFETDAEAGIYDDTTTEYQAAASYADNYWPAEGFDYSESLFRVAYEFNDTEASGISRRSLDITENVLAALKKSENDYLTLSTGRCGNKYMNYSFKMGESSSIPTLTLTYYEADIIDAVNKADKDNIVDTLDTLSKTGVFSDTEKGSEIYLGLTASGKEEVGLNFLNLRGETSFENIEAVLSAWDNSLNLEEITTEIQPENFAVAHTTTTYGAYGYGSYHDNKPAGTYESRIGGELLKSYVNSWTMSDFSRNTYANLYSEKVLAEYNIPLKSSLSKIITHNEIFTVSNSNTSGYDMHFCYDEFTFPTAPAVYQSTYTTTYETTDEEGNTITSEETVESDTDAQFKEIDAFAKASSWQAGPANIQTNFVQGEYFSQDVDLTEYTLSGFKASSSDYFVTRAGGASIYDGWRMTKVPVLKLSYISSSILDYINAQTDTKKLVNDMGLSGLLNASASGYKGYKGLDDEGKTVVAAEISAMLENGGFNTYADFIEAYDNSVESYANNVVINPSVRINFDNETVENSGTDTSVIPEFKGEPRFVTGADGSKALAINNTFGKEAQNYLDLGAYTFGENNFSIVFQLRAVEAGIGEFGHDTDNSSKTSEAAVDFTSNSYSLGGVVLSNKDFSVNGNNGFAFTAMPAAADFGVNTKIGDNEAINTVGIGEAVESRWHQIAYTVDRSGNAVTYVDDTIVASFNISSISGSIDGEAAHLVFGADGLGQYGMISGEFDNIEIYPFALGENKVEELYYKKMLDKTVAEVQRLLSDSEINKIYSQENKAALENELSIAKVFADEYTLGNTEALIEIFNHFNSYYNDFLNKDSKGAALFTSDIHLSDRSTTTGHGRLLVKSLNDHDDLEIDLKTWITSGDYAETGNNHQHYFFDMLDENVPTGVNVVVARGNHDEPANGSRTDDDGNTISLTRDELREEFQERMDKYIDKEDEINKALLGEDGTLNEPYYYLNDGIAHYIVIDNYDGGTTRWISPEQFVWLEDALDAISGDGKPIFVIQHLPITGSVGGSSGGYYLYEEYGTKLVELLNSYENDNIFLLNGHTHNGFGGACNSIADMGNFIQINTTSMGKGSSRGYTGAGAAQYINVYEDRVVFRARNFDTDEWLRDYDVTFMLKEATTENAETKLTVSDNAVSIENKPDTYILVVASYLGNKLIDVKYSYDIGEDNEISFSELGIVTENTDLIKAMLWDSFTGMKPLCK